ncbi:uncharacterized protein PHACADRAFT_91741 [Phanerochaete carnosa HHB-10118-sp]|uniref:Uncharacterized protein n=1 Tax=Phanerochaete carnosa (strain HHB-10118-sp) TaxID=650164 RepID=K5VYN2_PHACS|nr:uncharacterized protein PHACADRAFT_91741 [Phanerochaete carnosa HHB-10118-sp]EKM56698.1 hypothetical protein PHACADRAFT_91741 [Phanerochaete carnosa HHB-10118-sp]
MLSVHRRVVNGAQFKPLSASWRNFSSSARREQQRLVVLGSGWGGYEILRGIDKKRWNVIVVTPSNYFNFTPLLASCAVGTLEFRTAVEPVRRYTPEVKTYQAWCDKIDFEHKTLKCMPATPPVLSSEDQTAAQNHTFELHYDALVIAVGAYSQTFGIPGVKEHAHFLKDISDARAIRNRVLECKTGFEQANQPTLSDIERRNQLHFCIVGGGPTGVEFAAELHDLLNTDIKKHYPTLHRLARITLFDVAPNILGSFDEGLQDFAVQRFKREGIRILTQHHVEKVEEGKLFVKEKGEVPFGLLVWSTGLAPNPLIKSISEAKKHEKTHSLITDEHCQVLMGPDAQPDPSIFAIGDCAMIDGTPLPATAQGTPPKYLTKKLNKLVRGVEHTKPFVFNDMGSLAYLGDWHAVYDRTKADRVKTKEAGRFAWLLWRSAYFTRTLSIRNKILVPFYWFMNWLFGRDLSRF